MKAIDIQKLLSINDDRSGDHAQDGFDFQAASAIYLMFKELESNRRFYFVYEKVEDFIIFDEDIRLYQAKSTSKNLTDTLLCQKESDKGNKRTKNELGLEKLDSQNVNLSILEKIQKNLKLVKDEFPQRKVSAYLLWNKDYELGANLVKGTEIKKDVENLNLGLISQQVKDKLIGRTTLQHYNWEEIEIVRLLPKKHYEEVTCRYIEDVIHQKIGNNTVYTKSFFNSMLNKIRDSRVNKKVIECRDILLDIEKLRLKKGLPKPKDYQHLLTDKDFKNMLIHTAVKEVFSLKSMVTNPMRSYYESLSRYINENINQIEYPCFLCDEIKSNPEFELIFLLLDEVKIKAMIINIYIDRGDNDELCN